jgi:hypothetical protein
VTYPTVSDEPVKEPNVFQKPDEVIENSANETREQCSPVSSNEGRAQLVAQQKERGYSTVRYT